MKALSVRSPWWWFILHGGKDIENRDWTTGFRGPVLIHASKWWKGDDILGELDAIRSDILEPGIGVPPRLSDLHPWAGHIVGQVEIVDCVRRHNSRWFQGEYGFVLRNPIPFRTPFAYRGALGLFEVPDVLVSAFTKGARP